MAKNLEANKLFQDQMLQFSERTVLGVLATAVNSLILSVVLWGIIPNIRIIAWYSSLLVVSLIRFLFYLYYQKSTSSREKSIKWRYYFRVFSARMFTAKIFQNHTRLPTFSGAINKAVTV